MSCGYIKRLAINGTVLSQSVKNHTYLTRKSHSVRNCGRQTAPRDILLSANFPQIVMVSGGSSALPMRVGENTDGLFVTNAGNGRSEVLERPAGVASEQKQTCDPAVSAYKEVFSKAAMEGPSRSVSKVEAHADKGGKFEGKGPSVGKSERSSGKVEGVGKTVGKSEEDTVGKVEQMVKSIGKSEGENVGKTHRTEGEPVGKFEGKGPNVGKYDRSTRKVEGVGKTVGKSEEDTVGKVEQTGKSVGKSEGKNVGKTHRTEGETVGKFEGKGPNVGKYDRSTRKVEGVGKTVGKSEEDTVGKVEQTGKSVGKSEGKNVGKTHRTEGETVGKFEGKGPNVGKYDRSTRKVEGVGKTVGKSEEDTVGKVEQTGKSVGKSEGKNVGKTHRTEGETVGKSVGKAENENVGKLGKSNETGKVVAKVEGDVGTLTGKSVGKAAEGDVGKASDKSVGKASDKSVGKGEDHDVGKAGGNIQKQTMDSKEFVIAVAGKSEAEMSYVESITSAGELKLPEGATLVAYEQAVPTEDGFRVDVFMDQLVTRQFGRLLFYARELPSTHTLLSQNCKTLPVGTLSVADFQFQGKGRAGNSWESPKGCLMFSFTLQMSDGRAVPFLQYVASLAIIEAIESHCISKGLKSPEVKIKWPNDLYAKGLKVGGVLCTSTYSSKKFNIVVGVGLNVGNRQPTTCLDALLEEVNEETPGLSRDELLAAIINKFENLFEVFSSQGFFALESDYYKRWLHSGQTVVLEERQAGSSEVSHVPLTIQGLTPSGYLRAVDYASEAYELHPDGNSFDFLKGLMRKKM